MRLRIVLMALHASILGTSPAAAHEAVWRPPPPVRTVGKTAEVGGVWVFGLPTRLGEPQHFDSVGDDDEAISTAVWERRRGDAWQVECAMTVVRASFLGDDPATAFAWFVQWQERPPHEAVYRRIRLAHGAPAWLAADQVIWQPEPGAVASVTLDRRDATPGRLRLIAGSSTITRG